MKKPTKKPMSTAKDPACDEQLAALDQAMALMASACEDLLRWGQRQQTETRGRARAK